MFDSSILEGMTVISRFFLVNQKTYNINTNTSNNHKI